MPGKEHYCFMLTAPEALLAGFCEAAERAGINGWPCPVHFAAVDAFGADTVAVLSCPEMSVGAC